MTSTLYLFAKGCVVGQRRRTPRLGLRPLRASSAPAAAVTLAISSSATSKTFSVASAVGFCTKSMAPGVEPAQHPLARLAGDAHDHNGHRPPRHLPLDEVHAVGPRHDQIAGHDVGLQPLDQLERLFAVARGADDLERRAAREHLLDDLADVGGVVDDEHATGVTS